jgi:hypothetical protein
MPLTPAQRVKINDLIDGLYGELALPYDPAVAVTEQDPRLLIIRARVYWVANYICYDADKLVLRANRAIRALDNDLNARLALADVTERELQVLREACPEATATLVLLDKDVADRRALVNTAEKELESLRQIIADCRDSLATDAFPRFD